MCGVSPDAIVHLYTSVPPCVFLCWLLAWLGLCKCWLYLYGLKEAKLIICFVVVCLIMGFFIVVVFLMSVTEHKTPINKNNKQTGSQSHLCCQISCWVYYSCLCLSKVCNAKTANSWNIVMQKSDATLTELKDVMNCFFINTMQAWCPRIKE